MSLRSAETAVAAFWRRVIAASAPDASSLGIFRWAYGAFFLLFDAPYCSWIDHAPPALFDPPPLSLAALLHGFPPPPFFLVLDAATIVALCAVTVGYRTTFATWSLFALRLVAGNFRFSFGKIDHDILVVALLPCMAVARWGATYSVDALVHRDARAPKNAPAVARMCIGVFAVLLAFGMFTAGFEKAIHWIDFDLHTSGTLSWYLPNYDALGRRYFLAPYVTETPRIVLELADYAAPLFELSGFPALLISRRAWLTWLFVACSFHLGNALTLNISFADYVLVYLVFVDLTPRRAVRSFVEARLSRWVPVAATAIAVVGAWHVLDRVRGGGTTLFLVPDLVAVQVGALDVAIATSLVAIALIARQLTKNERSISQRS
jgi:hypothetical protein